MKRLFSVLAALVIVSALVISPAALADQGGIFTLTDASNISPGQTFDITLSISGDYQVHGMNLSIEYDPTSLVLESCTKGEFLLELMAAGQICLLDPTSMANAGMIKLGVICPMDPASGEGELFSMHFRLKEGVTVNQQVIMVVHEFIQLPIGSTQSIDVPFTTDNSIITVTGGSIPDGGYNEGGSGIGDNISDSPEYPTREPDDPDAQVTPVIETTPEPTNMPSVTSSAQPPRTVSPETGDPDPDNTETVDDTTVPDGTAEAQETDEAKPTEAPREAVTDSTDNTDNSGSSKKSPVLPIVIGGAAVVLAGVAAALLIRNRKK